MAQYIYLFKLNFSHSPVYSFSNFFFKRISVSFLMLSISDSCSLCLVPLFLLSGWLWETSRSLWLFSLQSLSVLRPKTCRSVNIFCSCNHSMFILSSDALHTWGYLVSLRKKSTGNLLTNGQILEAISIQIWIYVFWFNLQGLEQDSDV